MTTQELKNTNDLETGLLSVQEAAQQLRLTRGQVRRLVHTRQLPVIKIGPRTWRVPARALTRLLEGEPQ